MPRRSPRCPGSGSSLDAGRVSGDHVDVLTRTLRQSDPTVRDQLAGDAARLVLLAEASTAEEFARSVRAEARRLESDGDGLDRLQRQRRAVRLSSWIDRQTGMGRWTASWDPQTMLGLENRLDAQVQAMFHDRQPDGCPTDVFEKQSYLRAHALLTLLDGGGVRLGRPEIVVVVDHTTAATEPVVDWGLPVELPRQVLDGPVPDRQSDHGDRSEWCGHRRPRRIELGSHRPGWRTGRNAAPSAPCTRRVRSLGVGCVTAAQSCITSSGGATTAAPTSTTCYRSVNSITRTSTTTAGS